MKKLNKVVIVGGGVAGLICAVKLVSDNIQTVLYDRMDKPGRKFLLAGMSGLNLTNTEDPDTFSSRYRPNEFVFKKLLEKYSPEGFVSFLDKLGIDTFTGSSGKIFPASMKGDDALVKILEYLESSHLFSFHGNCRLIDIDAENNLVFGRRITEQGIFDDAVTVESAEEVIERTDSEAVTERSCLSDALIKDLLPDMEEKIKSGPDTELKKRLDLCSDTENSFQSKEKNSHYSEENLKVRSDAVVFALGGGSRKNTGSDGKWVEVFKRRGIKTAALEPSNCGFEVCWSAPFRAYLENAAPLKSISLNCGGEVSRSEVLLTAYGIEGSGIYFLGRMIREKLKSEGCCSVFIDIFPDLSASQIKAKLKKPRGKNSLSNYLRKTLSVNNVKFKLVRETLSKEVFSHITDNPELLKKLEVKISGIRPLEEAVSSAGGVLMSELDENMMIRKIPGFYVIGEMADWEAPTGGYLFQGCYSSACAAADDISGKKSK